MRCCSTCWPDGASGPTTGRRVLTSRSARQFALQIGEGEAVEYTEVFDLIRHVAHAAFAAGAESVRGLPAVADAVTIEDAAPIDVVRRLHPDEDGPYSWWSWMGQSFANDSGWRIDYHLATPKLAKAAISGGTDREASYEERLSDHAPVVVDYDF